MPHSFRSSGGTLSQLLAKGSKLVGEITRTECVVEHFLGGGGQGEVYQAKVGGDQFAAKWYFAHWLENDPRLRERLGKAIEAGAPSDRFLWPLDILTGSTTGFGYLMPLREERFRALVDMLARRVDYDFRSLCTAGFELSNNFWLLHAEGLCYRDISESNVFFDPSCGEIRICDNDNVDTNGQPGLVAGTPRFMAPEIVRNEASPDADTDLFSLSILLFYMFFLSHPLIGRRELDIHCFDLPAMRQLFGTRPLFIFDPLDTSNAPVAGHHDNALVYWAIYPKFLKDLFMRSFTDGLNDRSSRVGETEWRGAFAQLRDSIILCGGCQAENFYDSEAVRMGETSTCWSCRAGLTLPARIRLTRGNRMSSTVMANRGTALYPHHLSDDAHALYDFSRRVAEVIEHPDDPRILGLKNLSAESWTATLPDGQIKEIAPGKTLNLRTGVTLSFGGVRAEIRTS